MKKMETNKAKKKKAPPTSQFDRDKEVGAASSTQESAPPVPEKTRHDNNDASSSSKKLKMAPVAAAAASSSDKGSTTTKTSKKEEPKSSQTNPVAKPLQEEETTGSPSTPTTNTTTTRTNNSKSPPAKKEEASSSSPASTSSPTRSSPSQAALDLESALYKVTLLSPKKADKREYLVEQPPTDNDKERRDDHGTTESNRSTIPSLWVTFRLAHMGDAATLAALYCRKSSTTVDSNEEQISLWLSDGLGDENTPPSVFGLLAEVHQEEEEDDDKQKQDDDDQGSSGSKKEKVSCTCELGAALLLTAAWQNNQRVIRIEWYTIEPEYPNLAGHVWLRLATLALWTNSALVWAQPFLGKSPSNSSVAAASNKRDDNHTNRKASLKNA